MAKIYEHRYLPLSVYGNVISLLREQGGGGGLHLDIGCGYGAIAEPVRDELGFDYLGFDFAEDGLQSLQARGFDVCRIDLREPEQAERSILGAVRDRPIASLSFLDTLEHLPNGIDVLTMLRRIADAHGARLVLSVPNVSHKDIALKLLIGRWDVTEAGLLDHTHLSFYTHRRLARVMASVGWTEVAERDWLLEHSDQEFPVGAPVLNIRTPAGHFLRALVDRANPHSIVNQFVRAYEVGSPQNGSIFEDRAERRRPLLSLIVATEATRLGELRHLLHDLEHQAIRDFRLSIICCSPDGVAHDGLMTEIPRALSRRVSVLYGNDTTRIEAINQAVREAQGRFIVILDKEDRLDRHWVARLSKLAEKEGDVVLRAASTRPGDGADRSNPNPEMPQSATGEAESIADGGDRSCASGHFAIPAGAFRDLGLRLESSLAPASVHKLVVGAALLCGIAEGRIARVIEGADCLNGPSPDDHSKSRIAHEETLGALDLQPLLLPAGSATQIHRLGEQKRYFEASHKASLDELSRALERHNDLKEHLDRARDYQMALERRGQDLVMELERARKYQAELERGNAAKDRLYAFLQAAPLLWSFAKDYAPELFSNEVAAYRGSQPSGPFLTVITRTQGTRIPLLREALMCLAGQTCQDFELLIVVHSEIDSTYETVRGLVAEFPSILQERTRLLACNRPGRAAPLNDALSKAKGRYLAVLDDDDFVFGHWIETFHRLAGEAPGAMLRVVCARQDVESVSSGVSAPQRRSTSWFRMDWPATYDAVAHLHANYTPFMSMAFPKAAFDDLRLRFDETLSTTEDWQLATRVAMLCGVAAAPDVTSIYRWWTNGHSSAFIHAQDEWDLNRQSILERLDARPILLPAGATKQIVTLIDRGAELQRALIERDRQVATLSNRLSELHGSTSWRVTKPLRAARLGLGRFRGCTFVVQLCRALKTRSRAPIRQWRTVRQIRRSDYFDQVWYLDKNPDVAAAGVDPVLHYVTQGWREGRNPSPAFDTLDYLSHNPDVAAAGANPLAHFLIYGAAEGRPGGRV